MHADLTSRVLHPTSLEVQFELQWQMVRREQGAGQCRVFRYFFWRRSFQGPEGVQALRVEPHVIEAALREARLLVADHRIVRLLRDFGFFVLPSTRRVH